MDYNTITAGLLARLTLDPSIFEIDFQGETLEETHYPVECFEMHRGNNQTVESYRYEKRIDENWEGIALYIAEGREENFIRALNEVFEENGEEPFPVARGNNFEHVEEGLIIVYGSWSLNNGLKVQIVRPAN